MNLMNVLLFFNKTLLSLYIATGTNVYVKQTRQLLLLLIIFGWLNMCLARGEWLQVYRMHSVEVLYETLHV